MLRIRFDVERVTVYWGDGPDSATLIEKNAEVRVEIVSDAHSFPLVVSGPLQCLRLGRLAQLAVNIISEGTSKSNE